MVTLMPRSFTPREGNSPPVSFEYDAWWDPEKVWTFWRKGEQNPGSSSSQPAARLNTPPRMLWKSRVVIACRNQICWSKLCKEWNYLNVSCLPPNHGLVISISCVTISLCRRFGGKHSSLSYGWIIFRWMSKHSLSIRITQKSLKVFYGLIKKNFWTHKNWVSFLPL